MKSRGGLGREVRFPLSPLPLPRFYFFALLFTSHPSPLSERLGQAILKICQGIKFPCICVKFYFKLFHISNSCSCNRCKPLIARLTWINDLAIAYVLSNLYATFARERVHSGSLSWFYICLHDTTTKCQGGASHPGVNSCRLLYRYRVNAKRPHVSVSNRSAGRLEWVAHA